MATAWESDQCASELDEEVLTLIPNRVSASFNLTWRPAKVILVVATVAALGAIAARTKTPAMAPAAGTDRNAEFVELADAEQHLHWRECAGHGGLVIQSAESLCCTIKEKKNFLGLAEHCETLLRLSDNSVAVVTLYGENDTFSATKTVSAGVWCQLWQDGTFSEAKMVNGTPCEDTFLPAHRSTAAASTIDGYQSEGYETGTRYEQTLQGLRDWSAAYLKLFPSYKILGTNCQKFSTGVFNAVTHSHREIEQKDLQTLAMGAAKWAGQLIQGSVMSGRGSVASARGSVASARGSMASAQDSLENSRLDVPSPATTTLIHSF